MNYLATLHQSYTKMSRGKRRPCVLENPVTGERITFLTTSDKTDGRLHHHHLELPPDSSVARHFHPYQQKGLKVVSGRLRVWVSERE